MRFGLLLVSLALAALVISAGMAGEATQVLASPASLTPPPHPHLTDPGQAPHTARIMRRLALNYGPSMSRADRERDFLQKVALAKSLLGLERKLVPLRRQTEALMPPCGEISWEALRLRRWPDGDAVGVTLSVPVWVPDGAKRLQTYCGFEKKWQTVALTTPRPSGYVWFVPTMRQINDKARYRPARLDFELNSRFAPIAGLLLEYIFREGCYDPSLRVPLLSVRGGEDTYAVSAQTPPVAVECLNFPDPDGASLAATVTLCSYHNLAEIYHGGHAPASNHRLGLALDLNDFNFAGVVDGPPNPISRATRQYNRDAMHKLDARQMPAWVYTAAKWLGCRIPQEWIYTGLYTDWEHIDVGTK